MSTFSRFFLIVHLVHNCKSSVIWSDPLDKSNGHSFNWTLGTSITGPIAAPYTTTLSNCPNSAYCWQLQQNYAYYLHSTIGFKNITLRVSISAVGLELESDTCAIYYAKDSTTDWIKLIYPIISNVIILPIDAANNAGIAIKIQSKSVCYFSDISLNGNIFQIEQTNAHPSKTGVFQADISVHVLIVAGIFIFIFLFINCAICIIWESRRKHNEEIDRKFRNEMRKLYAQYMNVQSANEPVYITSPTSANNVNMSMICEYSATRSSDMFGSSQIIEPTNEDDEHYKEAMHTKHKNTMHSEGRNKICNVFSPSVYSEGPNNDLFAENQLEIISENKSLDNNDVVRSTIKYELPQKHVTKGHWM
eukprot:436709_1